MPPTTPGQPNPALPRTFQRMDAPTAHPAPRAPSPARAQAMAHAAAIAGEPPTPQPRAVICPYCGSQTALTGRCTACGGRFDPLSRQATQNHMGPWSVRDDRNPHRPGCTFDTLCRLVDTGAVTPDTVVRGPSTRQFWTLARHTPGIAHRLGFCHNCRQPVAKDAFQCPACHAPFTVDRDRQHLGVGPFRPLPGQATPEFLARHAGPNPTPPTPNQDPARPAAAEPPPARELLDMAKRAQSAAADWRRASQLERKRGWIALILAGLVVLTSLLYSGVVASKHAPQAQHSPSAPND